VRIYTAACGDTSPGVRALAERGYGSLLENASQDEPLNMVGALRV
jgi:hypothetical protein